jgi:hypothetical protein
LGGYSSVSLGCLIQGLGGGQTWNISILTNLVADPAPDLRIRSASALGKLGRKPGSGPITHEAFEKPCERVASYPMVLMTRQRWRKNN